MSIDRVPRTLIEEKLSSYWCELLGVEVVKRDDHFLKLGGNSMLATILANRIEDELGIRPSMDALFSTVEQLAIACEDLMAEEASERQLR